MDNVLLKGEGLSENDKNSKNNQSFYDWTFTFVDVIIFFRLQVDVLHL